MKKIYTLSAVLAAFALQAQFTVTIQAPADFKDQDAILYTLNGSKDIIVTKEQSKNSTWTFKYPNHYMGMMKVYFPGSNNTVSFISENKNENKITYSQIEKLITETKAVSIKMSKSEKENWLSNKSN